MVPNRIPAIAGCAIVMVLLSTHAGSKRKGIWRSPKASAITAPPPPYSIYLTFDDGPSSGSSAVNEMSLQDKVPVDVFLVGAATYRTKSSRQIVQNYLANPFVEAGNHSFTHANDHYAAYFRDPDLVLDDFNRNKDSLSLPTNLCRLPGRNFFRVGALERNESGNGRQAADALASAGYSVFGWDLEWRAKANKGISEHSGEEMYQIVKEMLDKKRTFIPGGLIILMHDRELKDTAFKTELEEFIRQVRADGRFNFGRLSEYGRTTGRIVDNLR